ncbi:MAG TPA: hypothetical protein VK974_02110 [Methylophilaceae bacterium]|nr:hypothetical protein [Methylophilaceae bacterium]
MNEMLSNELNNGNGGWLVGNKFLRGTGVAVGTVISLFAFPTEANIGTAGARYIQAPTRNSFDHHTSSLKLQPELNAGLRTSSQDLARIRSIFKPAVSDLASAFGVSRQAIYNWLAGEDPSHGYSLLIRDLALSADIVANAGIVMNGHLLKRSLISGKSFFELAREGRSIEAAEILVRIVQSESDQKKRLALRTNNRKISYENADVSFTIYDKDA